MLARPTRRSERFSGRLARRRTTRLGVAFGALLLTLIGGPTHTRADDQGNAPAIELTVKSIVVAANAVELTNRDPVRVPGCGDVRLGLEGTTPTAGSGLLLYVLAARGAARPARPSKRSPNPDNGVDAGRFVGPVRVTLAPLDDSGRPMTMRREATSITESLTAETLNTAASRNTDRLFVTPLTFAPGSPPISS